MKGTDMDLLAGVNHIAVMTADLDHLALTATSPEAFEAISNRLVRRGRPTARSTISVPSTASGSGP